VRAAYRLVQGVVILRVGAFLWLQGNGTVLV
jgi:hypothetical protein